MSLSKYLGFTFLIKLVESNISHTHWISFVFLKSVLLNHVLSLSIHIDRNLNVTMHRTNAKYGLEKPFTKIYISLKCHQ